MLSEQWDPLIFWCKGMHYRWKHHISYGAIVGGPSGQLLGCVQTSGRHRESCWHGKEPQRSVQIGRFNGVIQVVSPFSLCSSPLLSTLVGPKNLKLFSSGIWAHNGILESLSAFLMPCTIIETCSMAWISCGWIPQGHLLRLILLREMYHSLKPCQTISPGSPNTMKHGKNSTWESCTSNTIAWQGRRNNRPPHCKTIYKNEGLAVEWEAPTAQVWFNAVSEMMTLFVTQRPGLFSILLYRI